MIQTNIPCQQCGEPMIGIRVGRYYRIECDNDECLLFREGQGSMEQHIDLTPVMDSIPAPLINTVSSSNRTKSNIKRKKANRRKGLEYARRSKHE